MLVLTFCDISTSETFEQIAMFKRIGDFLRTFYKGVRFSTPYHYNGILSRSHWSQSLVAHRQTTRGSKVRPWDPLLQVEQPAPFRPSLDCGPATYSHDVANKPSKNPVHIQRVEWSVRSRVNRLNGPIMWTNSKRSKCLVSWHCVSTTQWRFSVEFYVHWPLLALPSSAPVRLKFHCLWTTRETKILTNLFDQKPM